MSDIKLLMPSPAAIMQSLRDIGYTLDTAVADIIDNSIAASADKIDIYFLGTLSPKLLVIDNGTGMSESSLHEALRFAAKAPDEVRTKEDLGRFGLGLKTASFSQVRKLTVISSQDNQISAAEWDLDYVISNDKWLLKVLKPNEILLESKYLEKIYPHGTIIIWENFDRFIMQNDEEKLKNFSAKLLANLRSHLELVFHKFLEGTPSAKKISITLNNYELKAFNPFCLTNNFTQIHPHEKIYLDGTEVKIQPYTLPHFSKMSTAEYEIFKKRSDLLNNQGVYIYRNHRLMVWGDWFRLISKTESTKYARIEVNFDKTIDHLWDIDIKKSKAFPPDVVLERIKQIIGKVSGASVRISTKRINKALETTELPWSRVLGQGVNYYINKEFPLYKRLYNTLSTEQRKNFQLLVEVIESSIPVQSIYADMSTKPLETNLNNSYDKEYIYEKFKLFADFMQAKNLNKKQLKQTALGCGLFKNYVNFLDEWVDEYYA